MILYMVEYPFEIVKGRTSEIHPTLKDARFYAEAEVREAVLEKPDAAAAATDADGFITTKISQVETPEITKKYLAGLLSGGIYNRFQGEPRVLEKPTFSVAAIRANAPAADGQAPAEPPAHEPEAAPL